MKKETFDDLKKTFNNIKYDLIIDDGLHNVCANLNPSVWIGKFKYKRLDCH